MSRFQYQSIWLLRRVEAKISKGRWWEVLKWWSLGRFFLSRKFWKIYRIQIGNILKEFKRFDGEREGFLAEERNYQWTWRHLLIFPNSFYQKDWLYIAWTL